MFKAKSLRVGNFIKGNTGTETVRMILGYEGNPEVHEIYKHLIGVEENRNSYNLAEINPIPLTEEWILRLGFEKKKKKSGIFEKARLRLGLGNGCLCYLIDEDNENGYYIPNCGIKFVHELQNLYFTFTGEELQLKAQAHG